MAERHSSAVQQVAGVGQQTVEDVRLTQSALWTPSGQITSRSGIVPTGTAAAPGSVLATTPTPNGFVHVQPFRQVMQSSRSGGVYVQCLDAIKDINILSTSADPSNARRDLIIAQQSDTYIGGDANSDMVVKQVVGTPSGSPVDPPVTGSADYIVLARVTVTAGATTITTGNITQLATQLTVATGGILPVANATERAAIANPYDGIAIYRRDLDWVETYDGGAWRAPQWCVTAALANITNPFTGQMALLTTDNVAYRWTGAAWVATFAGTDIGGEWRDARTTPAINTGSTKLQFATNVYAANGITFNGTDTWTVQYDGKYEVFCQLRATSAQNGGIAMGATTYADATHILPFLGFTSGPDYGLAGTVKLTAGTSFCFWHYNNGSNTTIANGTRNAMAKVWRA
jgi:hypothetical protein